MVVLDIVILVSAVLLIAVVAITAKFSREMPVNNTFDELWFEKAEIQSKAKATLANNSAEQLDSSLPKAA